jgi:hypothetical protein
MPKSTITVDDRTWERCDTPMGPSWCDEEGFAPNDELEPALDMIEQLLSNRVLTCAFCGEQYESGTPASKHERLTAHVMICPEHPMRSVERKLQEAT